MLLPPITIHEIVTQEAFDAVSGQWIAVQESAGLKHPFLDVAWISGWWPRMVKEGAEPIILAACIDGQYCGFAAFQRLHNGIKILEAFAQEFCDFVDWLCDPVHEDAVGRAFVQWLEEQRTRYDVISFFNIYPDGFCARAVREHTSLQLTEYSVAPHITINGSYEDYLASLKKKFVSDTRRRQRKLEREQGKSEYFVVSSREEIPPLMDIVALWLGARRSKKDGESYLDRPGMKEHVCSLYMQLFDAGILHFSGISIKDKIIALNIAFRYANSLFSYTPVFDKDYYKYAIMRILKCHTIKESYELGLSRYDFCLGAEEYKLNFHPEIKKLLKYTNYGKTFRGVLLTIKYRFIKRIVMHFRKSGL